MVALIRRAFLRKQAQRTKAFTAQKQVEERLKMTDWIVCMHELHFYHQELATRPRRQCYTSSTLPDCSGQSFSREAITAKVSQLRLKSIDVKC
jgi:hypothetical protein